MKQVNGSLARKLLHPRSQTGRVSGKIKTEKDCGFHHLYIIYDSGKGNFSGEGMKPHYMKFYNNNKSLRKKLAHAGLHLH